MSLDVYLTAVRPTTVYECNITHNLCKMAREAGLYEAMWRPEDIGATLARHLIRPLTDGLAKLRAERQRMQEFNPPNGWGRYENLEQFAEQYLKACCDNPDAEVSVSR